MNTHLNNAKENSPECHQNTIIIDDYTIKINNA